MTPEASRAGPIRPATGSPEPGGAAAPATDARDEVTLGGFSLRFVTYLIGPIALMPLLILRRFGLVADAPAWAYGFAVLLAIVLARLVEEWPDAPRGSLRLHLRIAAHVVGVTAVIYVSGWGPALGIAFAFSALADLNQSGASAWRAAVGWSLAGAAVGQALVLEGWMPSFMSTSQAQTIGCLGAFLSTATIQMAGAIGEHKEHAEALLAEQTRQAARARDDAQRSEAHHRAVVDNAAEGILTYGIDGIVASFNAAAEAMFGWTAAEIVGQPGTKLLPPDRHESFQRVLELYQSVGPSAVHHTEVEGTGVQRDGTPFPMMVSMSGITVDGSPPMVSCVFRDLSEQKRIESQLIHMGLHDPLTGLPNRVMLIDRLEQALARIRRHDRMFGVLFVDLDRFKSVNDTLGHTAGDQLLLEAATRLQTVVRETDTVARLGGDEFVVLYEDLEGVHQATDFAERILTALQAPYRLADDVTNVTASIGIALCGDGTETADSILANADIAMYRAKDNGRNRYALFDETMQQWITTQVALEVALRQAMPRNELRVFCQPFVAADTGIVRGFEALVRWERPGLGLITPDGFIPAAEETGLIVEIGAWVLEQACHHAASWARRWPDKRLGIAVNLSSRQLLTGNIVETVKGALGRSGLDPTMLTLELTESTLIDDTLSAQGLLRELKSLGLSLALDDFGTGYSSLTYLHAFPIDILKIDKSFVHAIDAERQDSAIVAAVIALANNLGLSIVAEGVENHEQLATLLALQCPYLQGYLFSHPRPIEEAPELVEQSALHLVTARKSSC